VLVTVVVMMVMMMMMMVVMMVMMLMVLMLMVLMLVGMSVKVFGESDFKIHGARDSIYGGYADCSVFAGLRLGTDWGTIFWDGRRVFGVHSWC
jgi:hypothetical protein